MFCCSAVPPIKKTVIRSLEMAIYSPTQSVLLLIMMVFYFFKNNHNNIEWRLHYHHPDDVRLSQSPTNCESLINYIPHSLKLPACVQVRKLVRLLCNLRSLIIAITIKYDQSGSERNKNDYEGKES